MWFSSYVEHPTLSPPGATSDSVIASPYVMNVDAPHSLALRLAKEFWQDYAHRAAVAWGAVSTAGTGTDDPRRAKHTRQAYARFFRMARDSIHAVAQSTVAHIRRILSTKPGSHTAPCLGNARQRPRRSSHQLCARVIPAAPARNAPRTSSLSAHRGRGTRPWPSPGGRATCSGRAVMCVWCGGPARGREGCRREYAQRGNRSHERRGA